MNEFSLKNTNKRKSNLKRKSIDEAIRVGTSIKALKAWSQRSLRSLKYWFQFPAEIFRHYVTMALCKLISLFLESVNISMKKVIVLMAPLIDLVIAFGQVIFFVCGIGSGLGCNSFLLSLFVKWMALLTYLLTVPVEPLVG